MKKLVFLLIPLLFVAAIACKKKSPQEDPVPYASYKINSVSKSLNYASNFAKDFCSTSTYCCRFTVSNDTTYKETLKIGIPGDPIVGYVYYTGLYRFSCFYVDPAGNRYDLTASDSSLFSVVFTQWDGQGGWAKGYFSGWMKSATNDSILFQNGYFQNKIWTVGTK
jgi:hypothetical protein